MINKWHVRFLRLAQEVSTWSKDPSTQVGCVLVDNQLRVVSLGFNGFPSGIKDSIDKLCYRDIKLALTIHAEENALLFATQPVRGCTAYVTRHPCSLCAAKLIQAGVTSVIYLSHPDFDARWRANLELSREVLEEAGVLVLPILPTALEHAK